MFDAIQWDGTNPTYAEIQQFTGRLCELGMYTDLAVWAGTERGFVPVPLDWWVVRTAAGFDAVPQP